MNNTQKLTLEAQMILPNRFCMYFYLIYNVTKRYNNTTSKMFRCKSSCTYRKHDRMENAMAMTYVIENKGMTSFVLASNSTCLDRDVEYVTYEYEIKFDIVKTV